MGCSRSLSPWLDEFAPPWRGAVQDFTGRGTRGTVHVSVTEIPTVQQLDDTLQVSVAQSPRDLRRHGTDLFELGVGEGNRRH